MASPKTYYSRSNQHHHHRYLTTNNHNLLITDSHSLFELDESDIWNVATSPTPPKTVQISKKSSQSMTTRSVIGGTASSLPLNVPDWSNILKQDYRDNRRDDKDDDFEEFDDGACRIPPHELIARQLARTRIASFSVHEGIGRTLKGRDLSRVRNAIWEKTGFQD